MPTIYRYLILTAAACIAALSPAAWAQSAKGYDTLFLTWSDDPTGSIVAQWLVSHPEGNPPEPIMLACTAADDPGRRTEAASIVAAFGEDGAYRHRVEFKGLQPGARYHLSGPGLDKPLLFQTVPARLDEPLIFAEGGDLGISEQTVMLHRQAARWDPLFAVIGGDIAYANGKHAKAWIEFLKQWHEHMAAPDGRLIPMVACIGNHEARGGFDKKREHAPMFYALFDGLFTDTGYAALDMNADLSFILLDSNHTTRVHEDQARWFDRALTERAGRRFVIPLYHVPMYPANRKPTGGSRGKTRSYMYEHWLPIIDKHEVPLVFEHDDHVYKRTKRLRAGQPHPEGTLYLGDGAWGKHRSSVASPDERSYLAKSAARRHVMRITLHPEGSDTSFEMLAVDEHGEEIDRYPKAGAE